MVLAICDDKKEDRELLNELLQRYAQEHNLNLHICQYDSGEALLNAFLKDKPQILFLDIYMNGMTGVQTARQLRQIDTDLRIIFVTTSESHFSDGFAVEATHYLVKPADYIQLCECFRRCKTVLNEEEKTLTVKVHQQQLNIKHMDIIYIEAVRNGIEIHHKGGRTKVYIPFSKIIESFSYDDFLQCHRAFLVNLKKVDKVLDNCFIMQNKETVPIRQSDGARIKAHYFNYFMDTLRGRVDK